MLEAVKFGHKKFAPIIDAIENLAKKAGKPKWEIEEIDNTETKKKITKEFEADLRKHSKKLIRKRDQLQFRKLMQSVKNYLKKMKT